MADAQTTYRPYKGGGGPSDDPASAYRRLRTLGKGAYGEAVLVVRRSDDAQFVIKEVQAGHMSEEELAKAQQEASVLRRLSHSNIIGCADAFLSGGRNGVFCIVTEFADRGDLSEYIKERKASGRGYFPEGEVLALFAQLCRALRHVHGVNILHRDLKSQNVFLASSPSGAVAVKLGDFGIAKVMSGTGSLAETQIGTPYYLSPEIYEDAPYGKKSDMWSLGVLWHEVAALELPFQAKNLAALARLVLTQAPRRLPQHPMPGRAADDEKATDGDIEFCKPVYSIALQQTVDSLLCKDPAGRPTAAEVMDREPLKSFLASDRGAVMIQEGLSNTLDPALRPTVLRQLQKSSAPDQVIEDYTSGFATVRDHAGGATVEFSGTFARVRPRRNWAPAYFKNVQLFAVRLHQ
jgi:NIMA (never in mitosis gene a)-related kinase